LNFLNIFETFHDGGFQQYHAKSSSQRTVFNDEHYENHHYFLYIMIQSGPAVPLYFILICTDIVKVL